MPQPPNFTAHSEFSLSVFGNNLEVGFGTRAEQQQMQKGEVRDGGSKVGSAKDEQRAADIKLGKTQSLKPFNRPPALKGLNV